MRKFSAEEIEKRRKIVEPCHRLHQLFEHKKQDLEVFWPAAFERGDVDHVSALFENTSKTVDAELEAVDQIITVIKKQEELIKKQQEEFDRHTRYSKIAESHFTFQDAILDLLHKEEPDLERLFQYFTDLKQDLENQRKEIDSVKSKGEGQKAYIEADLRKLAAKEFELLKDLQPFWHDWELIVTKIERITSQLDQSSDKQFDELREDVGRLLQNYHDEFTDSGKASQLGTELAINLYLIETEEIEKNNNKVPVAVINVDITAFNNLDGSHELGDTLIKVCYEELNKRLARNFKKKEDGNKIDGKGVVTILGRTRFKIVGVPYADLETALKDIPDAVMVGLFKRQAQRFVGTNKESRFRRLNTQLLAGYQEMEVGSDRNIFKLVLQSLQLQRSGALEGKVGIETLHNQLREVEKEIARKVHDSIKLAAAKAEYLEKQVVPAIIQKQLDEFERLREQAGLPPMESPMFKAQIQDLEAQVSAKYPKLVVYGDRISQEWVGRNYIPEEEFEGRMIQRLSHQIGFDIQRTKQFFEQFESLRTKGKQGQLDPEEAKRFSELKTAFYEEVLQNRHIAKSYDLRFTKSLREEAYDEVLSKMFLVEGPQVMTFIELDGFNAFNKTYRPDSQDTFYHAVLKMIYNKFDEVFNKGIPEEYRMSLRMTKQGDEIWLSYPLNPPRGRIGEKQHQEFLEKVRLALVQRYEDERLVIPNLHTVDWIPYLIEKKDEMDKHIENSFKNNRIIRYVDNSLFNATEKVSEANKPGVIREEDANTVRNRAFPKKLLGGYKEVLEQDEEDFSKWKVLDGARMITGHGMFGPEELQYAYLLFSETVKLEVGGVSERAPTGRVIRLGTTMGYAGLKNPLKMGRPEHVQRLRKLLNESIEHVRITKGRGGTHNLEAEGIL